MNNSKPSYNEDLVFGGVIAGIIYALAAAACLIGGLKQILWLSIVGFVLIGIATLVTIFVGAPGFILIEGPILLAIAHFGRNALLQNGKKAVLTLLGTGAGVFFFARILGVACICIIIRIIITAGTEATK